MLAYIRTALAAIVFGMAAIKFFHDDPFIVSLGWFAVITGIAGLIFGINRFRRVQKRIK